MAVAANVAPKRTPMTASLSILRDYWDVGDESPDDSPFDDGNEEAKE